MAHIWGLITPLITTHEPPSKLSGSRLDRLNVTLGASTRGFEGFERCPFKGNLGV